MPNGRDDEDYIVFDNLVRPNQEVTGEVLPVKTAKHEKVEAFKAPNAAGHLRAFESREQIGAAAMQSGQALKSVFS